MMFAAISRYIAVAGLLCVCLTPPVAARVVDGLYSARVAVADRGDAALNTAAREGLARVLVKITGRREIVSEPVLERAVRDARDYLQQYSYQAADDRPLELELRFSSEAVRSLVLESGAPLWTANRPQVLVWLVIDGPGGRRLVGAESHPDTIVQLRRAFERRGLPLVMPLLDLTDIVTLAPGDAWRQNLARIKQASARYPAEQVLVGRTAALSNGRWLGDWMLYDGRERVDRSVSADAVSLFLDAGVDLVADVVAGRFALTPSASADASAARLEVSGIKTYADYAAVVGWLESIELIDQANVEWLRGDRMTLNLVAQADLESLRPLIELNDRLVSDSRAGDATNPVYLWQQ